MLSAGRGMVARDFEDQVLAAAADILVMVSSVVLAKALALLWAIQLSFRRVSFETNCLNCFSVGKSLRVGAPIYLLL